MQNRKVVLYIAMSLDGYIATDDGGLEWLHAMQIPGEDYGYADFIRTIDTVVMGRKTYDKVLSFGIPFPHKDKQCFVLSRSRSGADDNVTFSDEVPSALIARLKQIAGKDIFIDGGAETVYELMKTGAIDRYIISVIPLFLGSGISLFKNGRPASKLRLMHSATYPSGLVQLWYEPVAG